MEDLLQLTDLRKAKGKLYTLELVLLIVILAKLCGYTASPRRIDAFAQVELG